MFDGVDLEGGSRQPHALGEDLAQQVRVVVAFNGDDDAVVRPGAGRLHTEVRQEPLHLPQVNAQPDDLDEPAAPAHHFVDARRVQPGKVAGAELRNGPARGEVRRAFGIAKHDVGAAVDKFAVLQPRHGVDPERAAGHRDTHRARHLGRQFRRQVCHPCRRFGLAVHHEKFPAAAAAEFGVFPHRFRPQPAPGLGDVAQAGQIHVRKPDPFQQFKGVRNGREGRGSPASEELPEARINHGKAGQDQPGATEQVAVDHGQPVTVGHRQSRHGTVVGPDVQVLGNRLGVGLQVRMREPHELGRARGSGRAEQEREVRVKLMAGAGPAFVQQELTVAGLDNDVGVVGRNEGFQGGRLVLRQEDQRVAAGQGRQIDHQRVDVVGCGERHEAPRGAKPEGEGIDPLRQLPVRHCQGVGKDGWAVPVARKIGGKGHPHEVKLRGHPDDVIRLGLPNPN